jgi:cell division septation protein DedD
VPVSKNEDCQEKEAKARKCRLAKKVNVPFFSSTDSEPTTVRPKAETAVAQKAAGLWTVQVAAFKSEQAAFKLAAALKNRGWEAHVTSVDVNAATVYRIQVGRFRTPAAAEKLLVKLKDREAYTTAFVVAI